MRKAPLKALVSLLVLNRAGNTRLDWDRIVLIGSTVVTIGLIALYAYGRMNGHW